MVIVRSVHVDGFGIYSGQSMGPLEPGLVVIRGDNEAGKSTFVGFVRAVLFGFPRGNEKARSYTLPPVGRSAGHLVLETRHGARYQVTRRVSRKAAGEVAVVPLNGSPAASLDDLLGGVTRDVFRNVFAFSLDELRDFRTMDTDQVRAVLYGASAGTGIQALPDARRTLDDRAKKLLSVEPKPIEVHLGKLAAKREELRAALGRVGEYDATWEDLQAVNEDIAQCHDRHADVTSRITPLAMTLQMWEPWDRRQQCLEALEASAAAVLEPDLVPTLHRGRDRFRAENDELESLRDTVASERLSLEADLRHLVPEWSTARLETLDSDRARTSLEDVTHQIEEDERVRLQATMAADEAERALREAETARDRAHCELAATQASDLTREDVAERHGALSGLRNLVRERERSEGAMQDLSPQVEARLRDIQALRQQPAVQGSATLTVTGLALLGAGLATGAALLAVGQKGPAAGLGGILAVVGAVLLAIGASVHRSGTAQIRAQQERLEKEVTDLETRRRQIGILLAATEADLAAAAPKAGMTAPVTAAAIEHHDAELRSLSRLVEARVLQGEDLARSRDQVLMRQGDLAERRRRLAELDENESRLASTARQVLESLALPQDWRPAEALRAVAKLEVLQQRLRQVSATSARVRALEQSTHAWRALAAEAGARAQDALSLLVEVDALVDQADHRRNLALEIARLEDTLRHLSGEQDFQRLAERFTGRTREALEEERGGLEAEQVRLRRELEGHDDGERRTPGLRDRKAELEHRLQQLGSSEDVGRIRAEEECIKARLRDLGREWSRYRVARHLVDEAWRHYERQAQPGVIRDAGRFFATITDGAYPEIFSPLSEEKREFEVQDRSGGRWTVDRLSSGTQEQLYLCLRFGFIEHQARVADPLPVVMDDILVNFDPARARRAAETITRMAQSVQVMFFTCHPATVEHFREVDPSVRVVALDAGAFRETRPNPSAEGDRPGIEVGKLPAERTVEDLPHV